MYIVMSLYIMYMSSSLVVNVTIEHKSDGCCGQEQVVLCNATRAAQVDVLVGNKKLMSYIYSDRNIVISEDGFVIRVTDAREVEDFLFDFDIEILFRMMQREVSITCDAIFSSITKNITANSKFVLHYYIFVYVMHFLGSRCLSIGNYITPTITPTITKNGTTFVVSAGVHHLIEPSVFSTLKCTVAVQCLNCSSAFTRETDLKHCGSNVTVDSIQDGLYMINITIYSSCGERFVLPSITLTVRKLIMTLCSSYRMLGSYLCRWETNFSQ